MAKRSMRVDHTSTSSVQWRDAVSGAVLVVCSLPEAFFELPDGDKAVYRYGVTQIVQDGAAGETTFSAKITAMAERAIAIENGEYRLGMRGGMVDADVFAALVALELATDDATDRAKWREATKAKRDVLRRRPDVAKWLAEHADAEESDAAVDAIFGAADAS